MHCQGQRLAVKDWLYINLKHKLTTIISMLLSTATTTIIKRLQMLHVCFRYVQTTMIQFSMVLTLSNIRLYTHTHYGISTMVDMIT